MAEAVDVPQVQARIGGDSDGLSPVDEAAAWSVEDGQPGADRCAPGRLARARVDADQGQLTGAGRLTQHEQRVARPLRDLRAWVGDLGQ